MKLDQFILRKDLVQKCNLVLTQKYASVMLSLALHLVSYIVQYFHIKFSFGFSGCQTIAGGL